MSTGRCPGSILIRCWTSSQRVTQNGQTDKKETRSSCLCEVCLTPQSTWKVHLWRGPVGSCSALSLFHFLSPSLLWLPISILRGKPSLNLKKASVSQLSSGPHTNMHTICTFLVHPCQLKDSCHALCQTLLSTLFISINPSHLLSKSSFFVRRYEVLSGKLFVTSSCPASILHSILPHSLHQLFSPAKLSCTCKTPISHLHTDAVDFQGAPHAHWGSTHVIYIVKLLQFSKKMVG